MWPAKDHSASGSLCWLIIGQTTLLWGETRLGRWVALGATQFAIGGLAQALANSIATRPVSEMARLHVAIRDECLASAMLPWHPALLSPAGMQARARGALLEAGFQLSSQDAVHIDEAPPAQRRLVLAYPADLLQIVRRGLGGRLGMILPASVLAWRSLADISAKTGEQRMLLATAAEGILLAGRPAWASSGITDLSRPGWSASQESLSAAWQRISLREPVWSEGDVLPVIDAVAGPSASPWPTGRLSDAGNLPDRLAAIRDFRPFAALNAGLPMAVKVRRERGLLGFLMLLALALGVAGWWSYDQVRSLRETLAARQAASRASAAGTADVLMDPATRNALARSPGQLWHVLRVPEGLAVQIERLEISSTAAGSGMPLKLSASALGSEGMRDYLLHLGAAAQLKNVRLMHHEWRPLDGRLVFAVEALWLE